MKRKFLVAVMLITVVIGMVGCLGEESKVSVGTEESDYDIIQQEISDVKFEIENNELLEGNVQLTKNRSLKIDDILIEEETALFKEFAKIEVPKGLRRNPKTGAVMGYQIDLELKEKPDAILAYNENTGDIEYLPFMNSEGKNVQLNLKSTDKLSIMPIKEPEENIEAKRGGLLGSEGQNTGLPGLLSDIKPVRIIENNGVNLKLDVSKTYFSVWWMKKFFVSSKLQIEDGKERWNQDGDVINVPITESGVYKFKIYAGYKRTQFKFKWFRVITKETTHKRLRWEQDVFVEEKGELPSHEIESLAKKHAPIVVKDWGESYNPSSLEYIYNTESVSSTLGNESFAISTIRGSRSFQYWDIKHALSHYGHKDAVLDSFTVLKNWTTYMSRRTNERNPVVYYSAMKRKNKLYLNYHFLYPFDPKGFPGKLGAITNAFANHLYDRESITVVLDASNYPIDVIFGAHRDIDKLSAHGLTWETGALKVRWQDVEKDRLHGNHPVVFMAHGAHATYPFSGDVVVKGLQTESAGKINSDYTESSMLLPKAQVENHSEINDKAQFYELRNLSIGNITSTSFNSYLAFSGYMVDGLKDTIMSNGNGKFPPFTKREAHPESYYNSAVEFDMSTVGSEDRKNMDKVQKFLDENNVFLY